MKVVITLTNGKKHDLLLDLSDADEWMRRFGAKASRHWAIGSKSCPEEGAGRTFVRASEVVTLQLIDDPDDNPQAVPQP